jgi:hypothetical protein
MVRMLVRAGADVNARSQSTSASPPIAHAILNSKKQKEDAEILQILIGEGCLSVTVTVPAAQSQSGPAVTVTVISHSQGQLSVDTCARLGHSMTRAPAVTVTVISHSQGQLSVDTCAGLGYSSTLECTQLPQHTSYTWTVMYVV